jgi:DNA replication protein DnaC
MLAMTIKELCSELKLCFIKNNYEVLISEAEQTNQDLENFLKYLLENEYLARKENRIARLIRESKLPQKRRIADFDKSVYAKKYLPEFNELESLRFIDQKRNLILLGNAGAGKTYYAGILGMEACLAGKTVLFLSVSDLIIKIKETMSNNQISKFKSTFQKYDLVILDELGYYSFNQEIAELFFNILEVRYRKGSMIITSNLNVDDWGTPFKDPKIASALISRLCEEAYVIELEREIDGRLQNTLNWRAKLKEQFKAKEKEN